MELCLIPNTYRKYDTICNPYRNPNALTGMSRDH